MSALNPIPWDGEPISVPGLYSGIPMADYHGQLTAGPSISSSGLRTIFNDSPAHYYARSYLNPERIEDDASRAFVFGRAAHHLLLGEADFAAHFIVRPEELDDKPWNSNRTACKAWIERAEECGLTILLPGEVKAIRGMAAGLHANPLVGAGILNGLIEHSMVWQDEETGVWVKVRPDAIPTDALDFADLKTAASVSDEWIEKAVGDHGYHVQAALVGIACRAVLGRDMSSFSLIFSEKTPPHIARVKTLKPDDLDLGAKQAKAALRLFARCVDRNEWPGPGGEQSDAEYVEIKPWRRDQILWKLERIEGELAA